MEDRAALARGRPPAVLVCIFKLRAGAERGVANIWGRNSLKPDYKSPWVFQVPPSSSPPHPPGRELWPPLDFTLGPWDSHLNSPEPTSRGLHAPLAPQG